MGKHATATTIAIGSERPTAAPATPIRTQTPALTRIVTTWTHTSFHSLAGRIATTWEGLPPWAATITRPKAAASTQNTAVTARAKAASAVSLAHSRRTRPTPRASTTRMVPAVYSVPTTRAAAKSRSAPSTTRTIMPATTTTPWTQYAGSVWRLA